MPDGWFRFLGVATIVFSWLAITYMLYRWKVYPSKTISQHAARVKGGYRLMAAVESIVMPLFFIFTLKWFTLYLGLPVIYTCLSAVAGLGLLIAAWVPHTNGWRAGVHATVSYAAALSFIPMTLLLAMDNNLLLLPRLFAGLVLLFLLIAAALMIFTKKLARTILYFQIPYILLFHVAIILAIYGKR